jgi:hypothetical protein
MLKVARMATRAIAIAVIVAISALVFHYYIRLRTLEHTPLVVTPGKWVWVECQTHPFASTIEEVSSSGMMISVVTPLPAGLPCNEVGISAQGGNRYFLPFRTVLDLRIDGHKVWSNPFPM